MKKLILVLSMAIAIYSVTPAMAQNQTSEAIQKWTDSETYKWILADSQRTFIFNLGVAFNLGVKDGFDGILRQRDKRMETYPVFQMYAKDVRLEALHIAYEAGSTQGYLNRGR